MAPFSCCGVDNHSEELLFVAVNAPRSCSQLRQLEVAPQ
jgi:hypothetical protein